MPFRLIKGGPEFEPIDDNAMPWCDHCQCYHSHKARCINKDPPPTYEQAIVHMYREAKSIVEQGEKLNANLRLEQAYMREARAYVDRCRLGVRQHPRGSRYYNSWNGPLQVTLKRYVELLDRLWAAQEKYNAWAKLYGDI